MAGKRQPTDVVIANGRKHLSKTEEAERRAGEVKVSPAKTAKPPKWLPETLKKDFRAIGKRLIAAGLYAELDADTLGRYLVQSVQNRDYFIIMGTTIFLATLVVIMNLVVDILYRVVDPRIDLTKGE
jgi:hypothetical protein